MTLRASFIAVFLMVISTALFACALLYSALVQQDRLASRSVVRQLGLSDLALFTEARYTRHPSMADLHTPFQDHPVSMDHFPTGSLIGPPKTLGQKAGLSVLKGERPQ